jgi:uncharacterized cupin superfamily protein
MSDRATTDIEVVARDAGLQWSQVPTPDGDLAPPGEEAVLFRSDDRSFSAGLWRRVPESGTLEPPFDEAMCLLRGEVEIRGESVTARLGPGDVLVAPNGSRSGWRSVAPVLKFWAVYHGPAGGDVVAMRGGKDLPWRESSVPADDGHPAGREVVAFERGHFSCGLWERSSFDRDFERAWDEVAVILEGEADVTSASGASFALGPGDVFVTPRGSRGHWRSRSRLRKFWAIYEP